MSVDPSMPGITRTAFRIYAVALLVSQMLSFLDPTEAPQQAPDAALLFVMATLFLVLPFVALSVAVIYRAYEGRNWARVVMLVLTFADVALYADELKELMSNHLLVAIADLVVFGAQLLALGLLFAGPSNTWFRERKETFKRSAQQSL